MNRKFLDEVLSCIDDESKRKEVMDKIMSKNGEDIEKHNVEVATLKNEIKTKEGVISNLNEKIKENADIDIEQIKKEQFDLGKEEGNKEVETFKKSIALKEALKGTKAKDTELLLKLISNDKLSYEEKDGNYVVTGLDNQIAEIKKTHDYLFEKEQPKEQRISVGDNHFSSNNDNKVESLVGAIKEKYN